MKFICNTKELSNACNNVMRAVSAKVTIPTIEGILIECGSNTLSLTGYDFEFGINTIMSVDVIEPGAIVINAKVLCDIIRKLDNDDITIETNSNSVSLSCGAAQYNITGIDAEDYPELPSVNNGKKIELSQSLLYSMVSQTLFAVADSKVSISISKRHIVFEVNNYSIISRLLDGEFIEYNAAIPKETTTTVLINTQDAIDCIERTLPVIENNQKNPIRCLFDNDQMRVSTVSSLGRVINYTHANTSGARVEIGFNSKFMLDALNASDVDQVKIQLVGPVSPTVIKPIEGDNFIFLVLPMRLKNENQG